MTPIRAPNTTSGVRVVGSLTPRRAGVDARRERPRIARYTFALLTADKRGASTEALR